VPVAVLGVLRQVLEEVARMMQYRNIRLAVHVEVMP
jgi:hypothetical protein